ncbi:hypothetical protein EUTSA_v10024017mg, partial [Eutrema salsugineum]
MGSSSFIAILDSVSTVWNPCLRETRWGWIKLKFSLLGMVYDSSGPGKSYKIVGYTVNINHLTLAIYDCATNSWKFVDDGQYEGKSRTKIILSILMSLRFSLLERCDETLETKIWVTKKKITNGDDGEDVVWIKFMSVSTPNFS